MYSKLRQYMIGDAVASAKTIFDITKLNLVFNIILIYVVIYVFGTIPAILGNYAVIIVFQIIGFAFIIAMAITLKKTKSIKLPRQIWFVSGIFFTLSSALLNAGQASYITYAFSMVNVVISFLMLGRVLRDIAIFYYAIFLTIALAISHDILPKISLPFDLEREQIFFTQPNIYAIVIALTLIVFIINSFIKSHHTAAEQFLNQKRQVVQQKELLVKKNNTIKQSISLASIIQEKVEIDWKSISSHFANYHFVHLPKENLSGEFFWVRTLNKEVYFALVDTGETGVPGAMFSFMVKNGLDKALKDNKNPSLPIVFSFLNRFINKTADAQSGLNTNFKISLCKFSYLTNKLHVIGVSQPIIVRINNQLKTISPNNHQYEAGDQAFELNETVQQLSEGDTIYLFSDGLSDGVMSDNRKAVDYFSFKSILYRHVNQDFMKLSEIVKTHCETIKNTGKQQDDITVISLIV